MKRINLVSIGTHVPDTILSNADLEKTVDTSDAWIFERTGIRERRIAGPGVYSQDLAIAASRKCLAAQPSIRPDLVISSTCTPGRLVPYQASMIAQQLELGPLTGFDVNAACSGLVYGLGLAKSLMLGVPETYRNALVAAGEKMSSVTDYHDRNTCVLFGDAGCALLISAEHEGHEILDVELGMDPAKAELVTMGGPGDDFYFRQDGRQVFRFAVSVMNRLLDRFQEKYGFGPGDPFHIIPHQANLRMLTAVADLRKIPFEKFVTNIDRYGNTSSASIGLALEEGWRLGRFKPGDYLLLLAFGGGLSWAGAVIRW